ncbi:hypothetical protein BDV29DRAFT_66205 [Aspergillus leporis]|jgi:hypothetical protein|uniref:Uncharacterized protein n=1 Tax=Aspergillus leporis TaxID=41062 RepID=A0A5N5WJ86_9EURO|nr:hypothetical protein BDV29DRAFT_66205 [Aspergillus leporis]
MPLVSPMMSYTSVVCLCLSVAFFSSFPLAGEGFMAGPVSGARRLTLPARLDRKTFGWNQKKKSQGNPKLDYRHPIGLDSRSERDNEGIQNQKNYILKVSFFPCFRVFVFLVCSIFVFRFYLGLYGM